MKWMTLICTDPFVVKSAGWKQKLSEKGDSTATSTAERKKTANSWCFSAGARNRVNPKRACEYLAVYSPIRLFAERSVGNLSYTPQLICQFAETSTRDTVDNAIKVGFEIGSFCQFILRRDPENLTVR